MLPQLGPLEFIIILVIFMIFFGAGKLGDLGGAIGRGIREFRVNSGLADADKKDQNKPTPSA